MASNYTEWFIQLIDADKSVGGAVVPIDDDAGVCNVLTVDDPTEITIYSDERGTSASNPLTMTNGEIKFWTDSSTTSVDLSVQTTNGHAFFLEGVTVSDHHISVSTTRTEQQLIIPYDFSGASETVVDTGFDILGNMLIKDVFIHVTTAMTGGALDIGTSTDTDGFVNGVSTATTGYPVTLLDTTSVSGSNLHGVLLAPSGTNGLERALHKRANATSGANIIYINTTSSSTAGEGYIYVTYYRTPTGA